MLTHASLPADHRVQALRFAASFLWADFEIADTERAFLIDLARELGVDTDVDELLRFPPVPEEIDPNEVDARTADLVRHVALRAIASDGRVGEEEMTMFELLDDLLPGRA